MSNGALSPQAMSHPRAELSGIAPRGCHPYRHDRNAGTRALPSGCIATLRFIAPARIVTLRFMGPARIVTLSFTGLALLPLALYVPHCYAVSTAISQHLLLRICSTVPANIVFVEVSNYFLKL